MRRALRPFPRMLVGAVASALAGAAAAQAVSLQGTMGSRALLIIDGGAPRAMLAGESHVGVRLLSTTGGQAVVEVGGQRLTLRLGDAPARVGGGAERQDGGGTRIVIPAGSNGHFTTTGSVNGRSVVFMVDTGASVVALGQTEADRLGLDYRSGRTVQVGTANGTSTGWLLRLNTVRIGDAEAFGVDAVVTPQPMPYVLLGNSFLSRFQMKRDNDLMVLERRF